LFVATVEIAGLVQGAAAGESRAWDALVERFAGLVWGVARGSGLSHADAADVSQTTWLRLAEHLHRLREPERVGGWLATTARNESLRVQRLARRQVPVEAIAEPPGEATTAEGDSRLLDEERDAALWRAFESLSGPCKVLLRTLLADPAPSYGEVSAVLDMPVGSIGPKRSRCLQHLRNSAALVANQQEMDHSVAARRTAV
jgi:RNA polymerase sigma factor (sigma-70 family)